MVNDVPVEVLTFILHYLSHSDRKACRLTCKQFYAASQAYSIIKNESIQIDRRMLKPYGKLAIRALMKRDRPLFHLAIINIHNYDFLWVFNKFGHKLNSVCFKNCILDYCVFSHIISKLSAVESLQFQNCDDLLMEGKIFLSSVINENSYLKNLKKLEITHTSYLTDKALSRFLILFPDINHLSLESTYLNLHEGVYSKYYRNNSIILEYPSPDVLTIHYVDALINSKSKNITSLNFSKTIINNMCLANILQIEKLQLIYLNINFCHELRQDNRMLLGNWQPKLTELQIAECDLMTDDLLEHICKTMPNLKILNISKNKNITDIALRFIGNLLHLTELDLSDCKKLSGTIIGFVICTTHLIKSLKRVKLNNTRIANEHLIDIVSVTNLTELQISNCDKLTNECLNELFVTQKNIRRLEMSGINISDAGLTGLPESIQLPPDTDILKINMVRLPFLQMELLHEIERYYLEVVSLHSKSSPCIQDLRNLETLNLSKCRMLADNIFATPLRFPNLRELNLANLSLVTNKTLYFLVYNCPAIEILNLSGCSVDDAGICVISQKMLRLKQLFLKNCSKITNMGLTFILSQCKVLQKLNIQGCSNLNEDLLNNIKEKPNMVEVIGSPNENYYMGGRIPPPPPF